MIKYLVSVLLLCSPFFIIKAQDLEKIDSLTKAIPVVRGKEKITLLNSLAWEYRLIIPDSTIAIGKRSYELGKKIPLDVGLAIPLNFIGVAYEYKGASIAAYEYYMQALAVANSQNDNVQVA
jgi:hypothetical protein